MTVPLVAGRRDGIQHCPWPIGEVPSASVQIDLDH